MNETAPPQDDDPQPDSEQDSDANAGPHGFAKEGKRWVQDLLRSYVFLTRLPLAQSDEDLPSGPISQSMRGFPVIGALIGIMGGIAYLFSDLVGLTPLLSASLAVLVLSGLTGAIHEQALVNMANANEPNASNIKGLVFMILLLFIKITCIAQVGGQEWGAPRVVMLLIAAASVSRAAMVGAAYFLHNGQDDTAGDQAGLRTGELYQVPQAQFTEALLVTGIIVLLCLVFDQGFSIAVAGLLGVALVTAAVAKVMNPDNVRPADRLGAVQQVSESVFLLLATALLTV